MSIKLHYLRNHLDKFLDNLGNYSKEQGERFHQDLKVMEERYQGRPARDGAGITRAAARTRAHSLFAHLSTRAQLPLIARFTHVGIELFAVQLRHRSLRGHARRAHDAAGVTIRRKKEKSESQFVCCYLRRERYRRALKCFAAGLVGAFKRTLTGSGEVLWNFVVFLEINVATKFDIHTNECKEFVLLVWMQKRVRAARRQSAGLGTFDFSFD
ncbi:hypothetical protein EVAR_33967_1 [Eumeta japonica]|uniref:Uncharacterized protein n=1 Tax=Eumeta variegata TaxID=151549 RepID=A0A4C1WZT3_EUMVA|nr:hypothetical protein EVAR_33967_1 [Eumeta japonica]